MCGQDTVWFGKGKWTITAHSDNVDALSVKLITHFGVELSVQMWPIIAQVIAL